MTDTVEDNKVVLFHYTLRDDEGVELDSSDDEPQPYLHGAQNVPPGLEREMAGKKVGDSFTAVVEPAEGFGEYQEGAEQGIPREHFPEDASLEPGDQFFLEGEQGQLIPVWITEVTEEFVKFDQNHPFAGKTLHFEVQIAGIRDANEDEIAHGHPHGPDGHAEH